MNQEVEGEKEQGEEMDNKRRRDEEENWKFAIKFFNDTLFVKGYKEGVMKKEEWMGSRHLLISSGKWRRLILE